EYLDDKASGQFRANREAADLRGATPEEQLFANRSCATSYGSVKAAWDRLFLTTHEDGEGLDECSPTSGELREYAAEARRQKKTFHDGTNKATILKLAETHSDLTIPKIAKLMDKSEPTVRDA